PAALAAADGPGERAIIKDAFASGLETSQLAGAVAVLAGGLLAALLLRRAERTEAAAGRAKAVGPAA
ncbi:MFS transporter, partial [Streptomyces sp. SID2119]|nr:MFS transporter [Streptomyces sp. SID2119]